MLKYWNGEKGDGNEDLLSQKGHAYWKKRMLSDNSYYSPARQLSVIFEKKLIG